MSDNERITCDLLAYLNGAMFDSPSCFEGAVERCDNIDALHKALEQENADMRDFCERVEQAAQSRKDLTIWGVDYMPLPLDRDGVPIHMGDDMRSMDKPASHGEVYRMELIGEGWWIYFDGVAARPTKCRHYHEPTVADVLREFVTELNRDDTELCDDEIIERFAKRLQLADGDAE